MHSVARLAGPHGQASSVWAGKGEDLSAYKGQVMVGTTARVALRRPAADARMLDALLLQVGARGRRHRLDMTHDPPHELLHLQQQQRLRSASSK